MLKALHLALLLSVAFVSCAIAQSRAAFRGAPSHDTGGGIPDNFFSDFLGPGILILAALWLVIAAVVWLCRRISNAISNYENRKSERQRKEKTANFSELIQRAEYLVGNRDFEHAVAAYDEAIKAWEPMIEDGWLVTAANPKLTNLFCRRSLLFQRLGRRREAILDYHRAIWHAGTYDDKDRIREVLKSLRKYNELMKRWEDPDISYEDRQRAKER